MVARISERGCELFGLHVVVMFRELHVPLIEAILCVSYNTRLQVLVHFDNLLFFLVYPRSVW